MPRPKSDDPKLQVNLRIPASVIKRWEAERGDKWRVEMERTICEGPFEGLDEMPPREDSTVIKALSPPAAKLDTRMVPVLDPAARRQAFLDRQNKTPDRPPKRR